jgi:hypothetical protein
MNMLARGEHRSRRTVLPNTPLGVANKISGLSRLDGSKSLTASTCRAWMFGSRNSASGEIPASLLQ